MASTLHETRTAEPEAPIAPRGNRTLLVVFTGTSFLGAFLLFLMEPMATKFLLPLLGGSPAVWNTAMVFFQAALLGGYAMAHLTLTKMRVRPQAILQVSLLGLALLALPVALPHGWLPPDGTDPVWWTLLVLAVMVGAPFFMLSTVGPTLQRWFSRTTHPRAADPYFLYAAGNAGSLLALLSYPFLIEPAISLTQQANAWRAMYILFVASCGICAVLMLRMRSGSASAGAPDAHTSDQIASAPISRRRATRWVFLALIPSALMLGVTRYISTDIASVPLIWVVPLSLYLTTFILAFGRDPAKVVRRSGRVFRVLAIPLALSFIGIIPSLWLQLPLQLGAFFVAALLCHGLLAADRPGTSQLTRFYLLLALGGVLGGVFGSLIAPLIFKTILEYPIAIVLALAVLPPVREMGRRGSRLLDARGIGLAVVAVVIAIATVMVRHNGTQRSLTMAMLIAAVGLIAVYILARWPIGFAGGVGVILVLTQLVPANSTLYADRTFFGVLRVYQATDGRHVLVNGTTVHGMENVTNGRLDDVPISYYSRQGPLGDVFASAQEAAPLRTAVIGAGAGSIAAYMRPQDSLTFFEIDGAVVRIATDPKLFSFVQDSEGTVNFVEGDGRIQLTRSTGGYGLIVVDAFSGDAIPTHLLTEEAISMYMQRLDPHGIVVFNISNRYFDLQPVLARIASKLGLVGIVRSDTALPADAASIGALPSSWVALARSPSDLGGLAEAPGWTPIELGAGAPLWTDDFTDLLSTLK